MTDESVPTPTTTLVLDNRETRVYRLTKVTEHLPAAKTVAQFKVPETIMHRVVPGLNFVDPQLFTDALDLCRHTGGRVRMIELEKLEAFDAADLVRRSTNPHALAKWAKLGPSPQIATAIEDRLLEMKRAG